MVTDSNSFFFVSYRVTVKMTVSSTYLFTIDRVVRKLMRHGPVQNYSRTSSRHLSDFQSPSPKTNRLIPSGNNRATNPVRNCRRTLQPVIIISIHPRINEEISIESRNRFPGNSSQSIVASERPENREKEAHRQFCKGRFENILEAQKNALPKSSPGTTGSHPSVLRHQPYRQTTPKTKFPNSIRITTTERQLKNFKENLASSKSASITETEAQSITTAPPKAQENHEIALRQWK